MAREEETARPLSDRAIECGAAYDHPRHGRVEVRDIWHGARWVEAVSKTDAQNMVIVRYLPADGDGWSDELSAPLDAFLQAID